MPSSKKYDELGVSSGKEDVHAALQAVDHGLFPDTFCKMIDDIAGDPAYCTALHADTAGTKGSLAYLYYREFNDVEIFRGVVRDAVVMNVDDLLCVGLPEILLLSNTIGRNKKLIPGEVIKVIIQEYEQFAEQLRGMGLPIKTCGGETADVGDIVRTIDLGCTIVARYKRANIIQTSQIQPGDVIVGLASFGQTSYEGEYNSGIGSNGLTLARHGTFTKKYARKYPEIYDPNLPLDLVYYGKFGLKDELPGTPLTMGKAVLSPTRTYTPVLTRLFREVPVADIHAIFHNTGGGQTKCLGFGPGIHYVKDSMFKVPPLFRAIQESSGTPFEEMYQVFNMGSRLEIVCNPSVSQNILEIAAEFDVEAKIVGRCERSKREDGRNHLTIHSPFGNFSYVR